MSPTSGIRAVLFDFGGVITTSPFEAFSAFEARMGLPTDFIRKVNSTNPDTNAWAQLERSEIGVAGFSEAFARESAGLGHEIDGALVLELLAGDVRPEMVEAVRRCQAHLAVACLTNNFAGPTSDGAPELPGAASAEALAKDSDPRSAAVGEAMSLFDVVVESRVIGVRKPDPRFYQTACELVGIDAAEAVFLDDLGINLKPARAMGMTTIKVTDPSVALAELESVVGFPLR